MGRRPATARRSAFELGVEADLGARQRLRDRTALLRRLRLAAALVGVYPGDARACAQLDAGDLEPLAGLVQVDVGVGLDALHLVAGAPERSGERHREAARL